MTLAPPTEGAGDRRGTDPGDPLHGRSVVLCVTGGIAAYKSAYLTRALVKAGARVVVVMSENAPRFVTPLTFETLSGNPVVTSTFDRVHALGAVEHVDLAAWADVVLVAPATYDLLGKLHAGIADDPVSTLLAAAPGPVFLAPAMNHHMWHKAVNQRNVAALGDLGYRILAPERGGLACSWEGEGRMQEPEAILAAVRAFLGGAAPPGTPVAAAAPQAAPASRLAGRTVLVSAGGTREALDPVRYVGNRSSGKMGYALAAAAVRRSARVLLVSAPTHLAVPAGVAASRHVESAADLRAALLDWQPRSDVLLMTAAVADFRPARPAAAKIKRGTQALQIELEPTPDILGELAAQKGERIHVGFALESGDPEPEARAKLQRKNLDLVVANRVGPDTGPDADTNQVWVYDAQGLVLETPRLDKARIAEAVLDAVEAELARREATARA